MGDGDICDNWEQFSEDTERLEKHLEKLTTEKSGSSGRLLAGPPNPVNLNQNDRVAPPPTQPPQFRLLLRNKESIPVTGFPSPAPVSIELDMSTEDSLRTQYVAPPPALKILSRPKNATENKGTPSGPSKSNDKKSQVTAKSLEQREKEYSEARKRILGDVRFLEEEKEAELENTLSAAEILKMKINKSLEEDEKKELEPKDASASGTGTKASKSSRRKSRNRTSATTPNAPLPSTSSLSRNDSERIIRQPMGPDGTTGFKSSS